MSNAPQRDTPTVSMNAGARSSDHPQQIGPYQILEMLGEGGMGVVYLAEQKTPVRRRVALKLVKLGMDTKEVVARFESERQALALMSHPNVAAVYDAGTTEQGRPYFVMEHVPGVPLTEYCDKHKLTTRERLELFIPVCQAIQHAHQKGIIHRDIKPSNVLVSVQDGKPVPKVIDFGIAKATNQRLTERTVFTEQGRLIGTPEYMSPEQAEPSPLDIDTRTDVYSLGVLLYELLTGVLPFDPKSLRRAGYAEIQRIIREVEPSRPSTRLSGLQPEPMERATVVQDQQPVAAPALPPLSADAPVHPSGPEPQAPGLPRVSLAQPCSPAYVAERRRTDPRTLVKQLRGDLDWITMKAMDKDRTRRYASASEFAADIQHYLACEPVKAGPPSVSYRLCKFAKRNKAALAAVTGIVAALLVGLSAATYGFVQARQERDAARRAESKATDEAQRAKTLNRFLEWTLTPLDAKDLGREVKLVDVVKQAEPLVDKLFERQRETATAVRRTLAKTYKQLGSYEEAAGVLGRATGRLSGLGEVARPEIAETNADLAAVLLELDRASEAESLLRSSLATLRPLAAERPEAVAHALNVLGAKLVNDENWPAAEQCFSEALALLHAHTDGNNEQTAESWAGLGRTHFWFDCPRATGEIQRAVDILRGVFGDFHQNTLAALTDLADCYNRMGQTQRAFTLFAETVERCRRELGNDHPTLAACLQSFGVFLVHSDRYAEAEPLLREALQIRRSKLGNDHYSTALTVYALGLVAGQTGRWAEAADLLREARPAYSRAHELDHWSTRQLLFNLANALFNAGTDFDEAEQAVRELLGGCRRYLPADHYETIDAVRLLATLLKARQQYTGELEQLCREEVRLRTQAKGAERWDTPEGWETLVAMYRLAGVLRQRDEPAATAAVCEEGLRIAGRYYAEDVRLNVGFQCEYGRALTGLGRYDEAEKLLLAAHAGLERPGSPAADFFVPVTRALVALYEAWGKPDQAAEWQAKLEEAAESGSTPPPPAASQPASAPTDSAH